MAQLAFLRADTERGLTALCRQEPGRQIFSVVPTSLRARQYSLSARMPRLKWTDCLFIVSLTLIENGRE